MLQYRAIEFMLGNKNAAMLKPHAHRPDVLAALEAALARAVALRRGAAAAGAPRLRGARVDVERDWRSRTSRATGRGAGSSSTATRETHWDLYQLGEELIDLEDSFRRWRFRHVTTVERVIGFKRGTGGTGGVSYLRMLDVGAVPRALAGADRAVMRRCAGFASLRIRAIS